MKFIGIIPARYASTRFPGKPLAKLGDKTVIQRVYEQASKELDDVIVATDDERIYKAVEAFGGKAVMTSDQHRSGTDRVCEAYDNAHSDAQVVINIQGDEPFIHPRQIADLKRCFDDENAQIATLIRPFKAELGIEALENPNSPKVVVDDNDFALYFSRSVIPYLRGCPREEWPSNHLYYTHVGIYAYRAEVLHEITQLPQSSLEVAESLEQLRWLQNGYRIKTARTDIATVGIDTPEDLERARRMIAPDVSPLGNLHLPAYKEEKLENGVVLKWLDGGTQEVNQLVLAFPGGLFEAKTPSVAVLCGQLMREGTKQKTGPEISEFLDFHGALFRSDAQDHYSLISLASLNNKTQNLLPLLLEMIVEPEFPEQALNIYRDRRIKEKMMQESKVAFLSAKALSSLMMGKDNPGAKIEDEEMIASVTREDLKAFHRNVFVANGCQAFLSGSISAEILEEVKTMLLSLPVAEQAYSLQLYPYNPQMPQEVFVSKEDVHQDAISIGFPAPVRSNEDYIPLRFTTMALGGYFGSRLMKNIREDKGFTYGIHSYLRGCKDGSFVVIDAQADPKYISPMIDEIKKELVRLGNEPMDDEELTRLRQYIGTTLMETLDSPFAIMDYYKIEAIVGMPTDYFDQQVQIARNLKPEIIMEMTNKYLRPEQMRIAIAGKR